MTRVTTLFPASYEASRARFRQDLHLVRRLWPGARLESHRLEGEGEWDEDLTIDWIQAQALERKERLLVLTAGEHGIEGYVGSAVLQLFIEEFLPRIEPVGTSTGLLLVHAINPWGMKHWRTANRDNVDLNRNFVRDPVALDSSFNPDYARLGFLLNPGRPIRSLFLSQFSFLFKLLWGLISVGRGRIHRATLLGQYRFPRGIYYGGRSLQEETRVMMDLYRRHISEYARVVHLDVHTGYGPRYQMSLVNSGLEARNSQELARRFSYPLVVKADAAEFFSMRGDMVDYVYGLVRDEFPEVRLYVASLEFGTLGDRLPALVRSLRTLILENRLYWSGTKSQKVRERIKRDFAEIHYPAEARWREKAVADARQAFEGILRAEGFLAHS